MPETIDEYEFTTHRILVDAPLRSTLTHPKVLGHSPRPLAYAVSMRLRLLIS